MMGKGTIIAVCGSDAKAGTSMVARSIAEALVKETGEPVLFWRQGGESAVIAPYNGEEMNLKEAGLSLLLSARVNDSYEDLRNRFPFSVIDWGGDGATGADKLLFVVNQLASSVRAAEGCAARYLATVRGSAQESLLKNAPESLSESAQRLISENAQEPVQRNALLCLNRYRSGDPYGKGIIRRLFPGWDVLTIPESSLGREADWKGLSLWKLGDRSFQKAIKEGIKWILNS